MDSSKMFDIYTEEHFRFSREEAELLLEGCEVFLLKKNDIVYSFDVENKNVYYLRRGTVKYHMIYEDGSSQTTAYAKALSFLGVVNIMPGLRSVNYCSAVTKCEVCSCPIELFMKRLRDNDLMEKMLFFVIGASRHMFTNSIALLSNDRLQLVDILRNHQMLTIQETADFVGCSRVHVSRLCRQLEEGRDGLNYE